ncbi:MAG: lipoyl synthase, partial [Deltaproteobacteria bacterium]
ITKSGLMLGLGECSDEVLETMRDLRQVNCDVLTLGQYLRPSPNHFPVVRFIDPSEFDKLRIKGVEMGFQSVVSGPLVRSSYRAQDVVRGHSSQTKGSSCSMG